MPIPARPVPTRFELEKNGFDGAADIDELLRVVFEPERVSLVPT